MAIDLLGPLPKSKNGNHYVLVIGDYFSCWTEALPVSKQKASIVADKLVDEVFFDSHHWSNCTQTKADSLSLML